MIISEYRLKFHNHFFIHMDVFSIKRNLSRRKSEEKPKGNQLLLIESEKNMNTVELRYLIQERENY